MEDPILIIDKVDILLNQLTGHKLLNSIEIVRKLGSGQHGKVILGKDLATKRFVAIKEISRHSKQRVLKRINQKSLKEDENKQAWSSEVENETQEYNFPKRILHEVNVMKRCRNLSPNIIKLFSVFNDTKYSNIYLILEYCYRGEIKWMNTTSVEDNTCKSIDDIVAVVKDITIGLEFLKLHNIIHRDIKPSNLLVDHKGRVKISDFGVSYIVDENKPLQDQQKELNRTVGTPMFLAPELCNLHKYKDSTSINSSNDSINDSIVYNNSIIQRSDNSSVTSNDDEDEKFLFDYKLDMWSFGVTVYCLVFNSLPFIADFEFELFSKVTNDKIVYPDSCLLLNVSSKEQKEKDIVNFIKLVNVMQHRLLIKSPNKRASIEELKHDPVFSIDNFGDNEAEREKFLNFNSQFEKPSYSITFDPPLFDQTTRSKSKRSLNKSDSESTSFANSRFNSLKTINSLASKNSTTVSSITSKTISVQSKNSASTALNESNRSNSNSNINTSKDHARMINSTSSNSIGQTSNNSHTTNNSKKSFGKLRKTFSKLMLLRSSSGSNMDDSTQSSKPSLRIPSSNTDKSSLRMPNSKSMRSISSITSDGTSTTNENVIMNKNVITNYEKSQGAAPDFEKPSFSRLLRKKSSQLLLGRPKSPFGNGNNNNNKSVEELNSPIKFKYSKKKLGGSSLSNESSPHDKQKKSTSKSTPAKHQSISVQEESSPLADISNKFSTVKLVDENDKLLTPEEYKKFQEQRTPINLSGSKKNLINELRNVKQLQTSDGDDGRNPNKGGDVDRDSIYGSDNVKTIETTMDDISEQTPSSVKIDFAKLQDKSKQITNKASISDFSISSFDVESRNNQSIITFNSGDGQLQNFFNKLTAKTADKKDILSDTHSNSSNVFEDYTSNDESIVEEKTHPVFVTLQHDSIDSPDGENYGDHNTRLGYPKLVTSAKTYNLKQYVYKSDLFEDDDEEDEDDDFGEHTEAYQPPEELDFNSLLRINKQVDSESSSVDNEQNITSIIDSDDEEEEEEDDLETDSEECSIKSEHDYRQSEAYKQRHPLQHINVPRKRHRHHSETRAHPGLRKEDDSVYFTEKNFEKAVTTGPDTFLINKIVNFNNDKEFIVENSKQKDVSATADDENTIQSVSNESSVRNMRSMTDYIQELDSK